MASGPLWTPPWLEESSPLERPHLLHEGEGGAAERRSPAANNEEGRAALWILRTSGAMMTRLMITWNLLGLQDRSTRARPYRMCISSRKVWIKDLIFQSRGIILWQGNQMFTHFFSFYNDRQILQSEPADQTCRLCHPAFPTIHC